MRTEVKNKLHQELKNDWRTEFDEMFGTFASYNAFRPRIKDNLITEVDADSIKDFISQQIQIAREEERKSLFEDAQKRIDSLYKVTEDTKPPQHALVSASERNWNDGFYRGELKSMELVTRELFGVDGDQLKNIVNSLNNNK